MSDFVVGITSNLFTPDGAPAFDFGLDVLDGHRGVAWRVVEPDGDELTARALAGCDAVIVEAPAEITAGSFGGDGRLGIVARIGVGYDNVDVAACTEAGTAVTITPDGVRAPMANAAITLVLMLSQHAVPRHLATMAGRWSDREAYVGVGLRDRTLGLIGFGNIGREVGRLARAFGLRTIAHDPFVDAATAAAQDTELVELDALMGAADFVVVTCALVPATRGLVDVGRLAAMRPSAYLVNVARGPIVDQAALVEALRERRIAGAGLDVFDPEPLAAGDPLTTLDNVILTAHSLGWTDQCFRDCGVSAIRSVLDVAAGRRPSHVVNPNALAHARWHQTERSMA
jgi:D-3-phosphoglycerate dehydrogenase